MKRRKTKFNWSKYWSTNSKKLKSFWKNFLKTKRRWFQTWGIGVLALSLGFVYQNCSDTRLRRPDVAQISIASQAPVEGTGLPPIEVSAIQRLVVVLDMSHSAVRGACPDDLDDPVINGNPCDPGFDPTGLRFEWVRGWINNYGLGAGDVKVMLVPYSGGNRLRPNPQIPNPFLPDGPNMTFISKSAALLYLDTLKAEQVETFNRMDSNDKAQIMGTSIIMQGLNYARAKIDQELQVIDASNNNMRSRFDVIVMGDGVPRPMVHHYASAMRLPKDADGNPACEPLAQSDDCGSLDPDVCDACREVGRAFLGSVGDPMQNYPPSVVPKLLEIQGLFRNYGVSSNLNLAQVCPDRIPAGQNEPVTESTDVNDPNVNILQFLSQRTGLTLHQSCSSVAPIQIQSAAGTGDNYLVSDFIVVNLNARVTGFNTIEADSDGDGLTDNEELTLGTDPTNPRSDRSADSGQCLDSIKERYGCKRPALGCFANLDADGDGLNSCEEDTISTDDFRVDSDNDGIPNLHEVLFRTQILEDDNLQDASSDGLSNKQAYLKGATAQADLSVVPANQLVRTEFRDLGATANSPHEYYLHIVGVPLVNTKAVPDANRFNMFRAANLNPATIIQDDSNFGPITHAEGINQIVVLIRAVSIINPKDAIWFIKRFDVAFSNPQFPPLVLSTFKQVKRGGD
ncbi:MAG: hypothetical protein IT289_08525 [Oligoflexia bacterium]|nr:hypothetical protein [Oligoflexia bacterium]